MTKFLTTRSRLFLGFYLYVCVLLILSGAMLPKLAPSIRPIWAENVGVGLMMAATFMLLALGVYVVHSLPSVLDLIEAAEARMGEEEHTMKVQRSVKVKQLSVRELSRKEKVGHILLFILGAAFCLFGIVDVFGFGPPPVKTWSYVEERYISMPTWLSGILAIITGTMCYFGSYFLRTKMVDRWDEALKKLLSGGGKAAP